MMLLDIKAEMDDVLRKDGEEAMAAIENPCVPVHDEDIPEDVMCK